MARRTADGEALKEWIEKLREALGDRRFAYLQTFKGPRAEVVLKDLARFCRAHESTFVADPRAHAVAEGRREVWLRIQNHLRLSPDQLWTLYTGRPSED
jgi:hypothetical protein